jgi:hypothetical protein
MKVKLSRTQFFSLLQVFQVICLAGTSQSNFEARLLMLLLDQIKKQLIKKSLDFKQKYSLSLNEQEALAFYIFFKKFHFFSTDAMYEANMVDMLCNQIHQKFTL